MKSKIKTWYFGSTTRRNHTLYSSCDPVVQSSIALALCVCDVPFSNCIRSYASHASSCIHMLVCSEMCTLARMGFENHKLSPSNLFRFTSFVFKWKAIMFLAVFHRTIKSAFEIVYQNENGSCFLNYLSLNYASITLSNEFIFTFLQW